MTCGSSTPFLSTTKRDSMPLAFTMNSADEGRSAVRSPRAIASLWRAFSSATNALKLRTSSSFVMRSLGVKRPVPERTTSCIRHAP